MSKKTLTPTQWKELENAITIFHQVTLKIDGYDIAIEKQMDNISNKLYFMVWVNSVFDGKNSDKESEIGKRFYQRRYFWYPKKSEWNRVVKGLGKRAAKRIFNGEPKKIQSCFSPNYSSFRTLKKVLIDNNESIEIISL